MIRELQEIQCDKLRRECTVRSDERLARVVAGNHLKESGLF